LRGVAQQENPENDYYVPPQHWDDANYLAHNVAGGNQAITSANASGEPIVNPDPDDDNGWDTNNPLPVIGPMTFQEYSTYTDTNLEQASSSLGDGDLTGSKSEITAAMD
ncbi:hypothetical protein AB4400_31595, partial [Vibrio sp. 10N.261.48.A2]